MKKLRSDIKSERKLSLLEAKSKIESFCAYQERCHQEVDKKLHAYGIDGEDRLRLISSLIQDRFLNEERFARAFVSGKFRFKKWGRVKIRQHLKQKGVQEKLIEIGFQEIDHDEYFQALNELAQKKREALANKKLNEWELKQRIGAYLSQKGYEFDLIREVID